MIEIILGMEEWLKHGDPTRNQIECLSDIFDNFVHEINLNGQREGMGTK